MKKILLVSLGLLSTSCVNLAPTYVAPDMAVPSSWREEEGDGQAVSNSAWWESLGDPVLGELINIALQNNKDLQVAAWRVSEYFAQYQKILGGLFPQISGMVGGLKEKVSVDEDFLPLQANPITPDFHLNVAMSFELDFWSKTRNASSAAFSQYLAEIENRRTVVLVLVSSVAQAYVYLRQLDLQLSIAKSIVESRKESLEIARYRFEGGLTSEIEVEQALSVYQEAIVMVKNLEREVPQQENLLSVLLGQAPGPIVRGKTIHQLELPKQVELGKPEELLTRRPDILRLENLLRAANADIGVARAAFFPQVSLSGLFGVDSLQLKTLLENASTTWLLGGSLLQTIFAGGSLVAQLRITEAQKQEMIFSYEQSILKALQEVNDACIGWQKSQEIYDATLEEVVALKEYLKLAWYRYYNGQTQYLTVLDAERKVFDAELSLASAQSDQFLYLINLYKALGGGWVIHEDQRVQQQQG